MEPLFWFIVGFATCLLLEMYEKRNECKTHHTQIESEKTDDDSDEDLQP